MDGASLSVFKFCMVMPWFLATFSRFKVIQNIELRRDKGLHPLLIESNRHSTLNGRSFYVFNGSPLTASEGLGKRRNGSFFCPYAGILQTFC